MRFDRLTHVVAGLPGLYKLWRDVVEAKLALAERVECQVVAHELIKEARAEASVDDGDRPVADAVHGHADVSRQELV